MSRSRSFDTITGTDNANPVHPWHELTTHQFYLGGVVSTEGGLWLALTSALLLVPLVMAAFFYPMQALIWAAATALVLFAGYEGYAIRKRRRLRG